jgi:cbb3-type cytochrome oxidase cytochrome c subunit
MKGLAPLFLGIFGTFAFSWIGLTVIPAWQIGHLNPESDEEGTDIYPRPQSGMFERGAHVYAANGCVYCHSQQVRADYIADDIQRKWGNRRSAPRDYIFDRPVFLGKMRMGQDLANIGARAPAPEESPSPAGAGSPAAAPPAQGAATSISPGTQTASPSPAAQGAPASSPPAKAPAKANPPSSPGSSPGTAPAGSPGSSPPTSPAASPASSPPTVLATSPAPSPAGSAAVHTSPAPPGQRTGVASPSPGQMANATPGGSSPAAPSAQTPGAPWPIQTAGLPPMFSAAWHHVHLYAPRSINPDSNMPAYRFLYEKRRIAGERSAEALQLSGGDAPPEGWEVVPTYDAKCVVAYLMGLNQSHPLKEVRSAGSVPPTGGAPSPAAPGASPAAPATGSPAAPKK